MYFDFISPFQITTFFVNSLFIRVTSMFKLPNFKNMTEFQRLIDDLEQLKSTKLYENSFKAIDDCIHLLYSRKNYFESLEQIEKKMKIMNLSSLQICPLCKGTGVVDNGFYTQTSGTWISSGTSTIQCRTCYGKGVIKY